MDFLYDGHDARDSAVFRALPDPTWYYPPNRFEHGEWHKVADIPKREGGDGNPSRIYECRMPARFYKLEVLDSTNSVGEPTNGFTLSTGSGEAMGALLVQIALAVRDGMLGWDGKKENVHG